MDFGHFEPFFSVFVRSEGAMRSYCAACRPPDIKLRSCLVQRLWYIYFYAAELPIGGAWARQKWDFAIFWSFFVLWGYIPNPHAPNSSYYPLNLTPTLPVNNSRKILTTWKKNFHFFHDFWCMVTPSPIWPNVTPWGAPLRPPSAHISFFTSIQCLYSGLYHLMHSEIELTAWCHPTFNRGHDAGFWPFWAIFFCFCQDWGDNRLLLRCWQTSRHKTAFLRGIEIVLYMFLCSRIAHWRGLSMAKMGFCPFLGIFCYWGVYSQPPRTQQFLLSLESHSHPTSE